MIGDLTGAPQPVVVKLFSPDATLLATWAPQVADALGKITDQREKTGGGYRGWHRGYNQRAGRGFHGESANGRKGGVHHGPAHTAASAIVDGEPAATPVVINDRPYTLRVRFPEANRASLEAMSNTMLVNSNGGTATLGSMADVKELPGQTEILRDNLQRDVEVTARLGRGGFGHGRGGGAKSRERT